MQGKMVVIVVVDITVMTDPHPTHQDVLLLHLGSTRRNVSKTKKTMMTKKTKKTMRTMMTTKTMMTMMTSVHPMTTQKPENPYMHDDVRRQRTLPPMWP